MPDLIQRLEALVQSLPDASKYIIKASDYFYDDDNYIRYEAACAEFENEYQQYATMITDSWGPPDYVGSSPTWYPEAFHISCWQRDDVTAFIALEHQDKELPLFLLLGAYTQDEIEKLSRNEW